MERTETKRDAVGWMTCTLLFVSLVMFTALLVMQSASKVAFHQYQRLCPEIQRELSLKSWKEMSLKDKSYLLMTKCGDIKLNNPMYTVKEYSEQ